MKLTIFLLLGSLSLLLVSALDESIDVEIKSRNVREAREGTRNTNVKKNKKNNKRSGREKKRSRKERERKRSRKERERKRSRKEKERKQSKKERERKRSRKDKERKRSGSGRRKGKNGARRGNNEYKKRKESRTPVPPAPVPSGGGGGECPPAPPCDGGCDKLVMEKAMGFKKAQNWYRQCKRIKSQGSFIMNKMGKSGDFMEGAMALEKVTMNGTKCADESMLKPAMEAMDTLNGCKASVEMDCMCPSPRQSNSTGDPDSAATAAPGAPTPVGPEATPDPGSPMPMTEGPEGPEGPMGMCMECEEENMMKLKEIIDAYNDCIEKSRHAGVTRQDSDLCMCLEAVHTPDPMLNPGDLVMMTKDQAAKCKDAFGMCSKALKSTGPLVASCCMSGDGGSGGGGGGMSTAKARMRNFLKQNWI